MNNFNKIKKIMYLLIFIFIIFGVLSNVNADTLKEYSFSNKIMIVSHLDDDILFFLPYIDIVDKIYIVSVSGTAKKLNIAAKYSTKHCFTRGITSIKNFKEICLNKEIRREYISEENLDIMLRDIIADPTVKEIYTHNPWGEYGHIHHRMVSSIVKKLAVEYKKDVWCPDVVIWSPDYNPVYTYADIQLESKWEEFDTELFIQLRQIYLDEPKNETFPVVCWTWDLSIPDIWQKYFLAVHDGKDYTINNQDVQELVELVPIFGL